MEKILDNADEIITSTLTESEIAEQITRFQKFRKIQPGSTIKVAFFTAPPNYHTTSLSDYWSTYHSNINPKDTPPGSIEYQTIENEYKEAIQCLTGFKTIDDTKIQQRLFDRAIAAWSSVSNITIIKVDDPDIADIRIGLSSGVNNINFCPGDLNKPRPGDIFLNTGNRFDGDIAFDKSANTLMHEFGHALGLSHPSKREGDGKLPREYGKQRYSVLSYESIEATEADKNPGFSRVTTAGFFPLTPMLFDALGLEKMGLLKASQNTEDNSIYRFQKYNSAKLPTGQLIIDNNGDHDTIDASLTDTANEIDLRPTDFSTGKAYFSSIGAGKGQYNVAIYKGSTIENAIGGNLSDLIIGNDVANQLDGRGGNDTLQGGKGFDTYIIGSGRDSILDSAGDGRVLVGEYELKGSSKAQVVDRQLNNRGATWRDDARSDLFYVLENGPSSDDKKLLIVSRQGNKDSVIGEIQHFQNGQLGISLKDEGKIRIDRQTASNPFSAQNNGQPTASQALGIEEHFGQGLKVFLNKPAHAGDIIKLALSTLGDQFETMVDGARTGFGSGDVTLALAEGQTEIAFALLNTGDIVADTSLTLTAAFQAADGSETFEDTLDVNIDSDEAPTEPEIAHTIIGDVVPTDLHPETPEIEADFTFYGDTYISNSNLNPIGIAGAYADNLFGDYANDHIIAGDLDDYVNGKEGDDWLEGDSGNDFLIGNSGNDLIEGGTDGDILIGDDGNDRIYSNIETDTTLAIKLGNTTTGSEKKGDWLSGGEGNDTLVAGEDNDVLTGGAGSDLIIAGAGNDNIFGDSNYEPVLFFAEKLQYSLWKWGYFHNSLKVFNWEITYTDNYFIFSQALGHFNPPGGADDVIYAGAGNDHAWGGDGNDNIFGEDGDDFLAGQAGNDMLLGGSGADLIWGDDGSAPSISGDDYLDGGEGNDTLHAGAGDDVLYGGAGDDFLFADENDQFDGDDYLDGGDGNDSLIGAGGADTLYGGSGNDNLEGDGLNSDTPGDDYLDGEDGNDTLNGGDGADVLYGGSGNDELYGDAANTPLARMGDDYLDGEDGDDYLDGSGGNDTLLGGSGNDQLFGDDDAVPESAHGDDVLDGGDGNDTLHGEGGNDSLLGGEGNDLLFGEAGNDTLNGGGGSNLLQGDSGDDVYVVTAGSQNLIDDSAGKDTLAFDFEDGIDIGSITTSINGTQLIIHAGDSQIVINNGLAGSIEQFDLGGASFSLQEFLDATLRTSVNISGITNNKAATLLGGGGDDRLTAGFYADTLIGGHGDDILDSQGSEATFAFKQGDGHDRVLNGLSIKTFSFVKDASILSSSARLSKAAEGSRDLLLTYGEVGDSIFIEYAPSIIEQTYSFADGTVLTHRQLLEQSGLGLDWLGTESEDIVSGTSNNDRMLGDSGNDALDGLNGNDWLDGGTGQDTLTGGDGDDVLIGGGNDDTLYGGAGNDMLAGGEGSNQLNGGAGHDVYILGYGTYNEIVDQDPAGEETIRLPEGMRLADFYAARLDNDLIIQNRNDGTAAKIVGYFAKAVEGKTWVVASDSEPAESLRDWVKQQIDSLDETSSTSSESRRAGFEAALKIDLGQLGSAGKTLGGLVDFSDSSSDTYFDSKLDKYVRFKYSFDGVKTASTSMTDTSLALDSSEIDSVFLSETTFTRTLRNPVYEAIVSPGRTYTVYRPSGMVSYPYGATVTDLDHGYYRIQEVNYIGSVFVGESISNEEIIRDTNFITRTFTITNVKGTAGDDTVTMGWEQGPNIFRGTVMAGDGNDNIDLGTTSKIENDWYSGGSFYSYIKPKGLGAYIDGGNGADTLIGTDGNDILVSGQGNDFLDGGLGTDTYYVSLDTGSEDVIYDSGDPGWNAFAGSVYGGQFPLDVLAFDAGVTIQDLSWRLIENSAYDNHHALEIFGGKGKIIVVFDDAPNPQDTESAIGIERFKFADGTVLTRAEFMAQAAEINSPTVNGGLSDISVADNSLFSYKIPENVFSPTTGGDYLRYQVQLANGDPLPAWLTFDSSMRTLSGTPLAGTSNTITLRVLAINAAGESAETLFNISVTSAQGQNFSGTRAGDTLIGTSGDDTLNGGAGPDTLIGGLGNDTYSVDRGSDRIIEAAGAGIDSVIASSTYILPENVENMTLSGSANIRGYGNSLDNTLNGNIGNNQIFGADGNDTIHGNAGTDQLFGGNGNDLLFGDTGDDLLKGDAGNDQIDGGDGYDVIYGANGNDIANGGSGNDYLSGGNGFDTLDGGIGNDILDGGNNADTLNDLNGNNVILGGANNDAIITGAGSDLLAGGTGNDVLVSHGGHDVILFNQGDGYDKITLDGGTSATVSLGGGIAYADLTLKKSGLDLILGTGDSEGIVFKAWYSNAQTKNVQNLQVIAEAMNAFDANGMSPLLNKKVQTFDFKALVNQFDRVRTSTTGLSTWAINDALSQFHIASSDSSALGGDLAYQYGKNRILTGMNLGAAQAVIDDPNFGVQAQTLKPLSGLQGAAITL